MSTSESAAYNTCWSLFLKGGRKVEQGGERDRGTDFLGKSCFDGSFQGGGARAVRFPSMQQGHPSLQFAESDNGNTQ